MFAGIAGIAENSPILDNTPFFTECQEDMFVRSYENNYRMRSEGDNVIDNVCLSVCLSKLSCKGWSLLVCFSVIRGACVDDTVDAVNRLLFTWVLARIEMKFII